MSNAYQKLLKEAKERHVVRQRKQKRMGIAALLTLVLAATAGAGAHMKHKTNAALNFAMKLKPVNTAWVQGNGNRLSQQTVYRHANGGMYVRNASGNGFNKITKVNRAPVPFVLPGAHHSNMYKRV